MSEGHAGIFQEDRYERQRRIWGSEGEKNLGSARVLLVGVGGIGVEVAKNLAAAGVGRRRYGGRLVLVDPDTVALSNMNRVVFFRESDVGKPKVDVVAKYLREFNPELDVVSIFSKIEDEPSIFDSVDLVVLTADREEAREFVNYHCVVKEKKIVEGSLEVGLGFVRVYIPEVTPCLMCHNLWPSESILNISCTIRGHPETPEECLAVAIDDFYGVFKRYPEDVKDDVEWVYSHAKRIAEKFCIRNAEKITVVMIREIVGTSVAAIGAPNSAIGGIISMIVIHFLTGIKNIDYNLVYVNFDDMILSKYNLNRREDCICSLSRKRLSISSLLSVEDFAREIKTTFHLSRFAISVPGINRFIYPNTNNHEAISKFVHDQEILLVTNIGDFENPESFLVVIDFET